MPAPSIQPAAFIHDPQTGPLHRPFYTLTFPVEWREAVRDLWASTRPAKYRDAELQKRSVPIKRLNMLMRAVAPELIAVASYAAIDSDRPWIYATEPYPPVVLRGFLNAWLHDMPRKPREESNHDSQTYRRIQQTMRLLDSATPQWQLTSVDLLGQQLSDGGTALPDQPLFRLLPEYLADKIADYSRHTPYEHGGERHEFRRVAGFADNGAELISWPPIRFPKDHTQPAYFSAYIRLALRTSPFSPVPRIHMSTGIRRWISGKLRTRGRRAASAYLLAESSLVPDGPVPERFAVAQIAWTPPDKKAQRQGMRGRVEWRDGGLDGMLERVSMLQALPEADILEKDAADLIGGRDGLSIAVTHHTTMGKHPIKGGLMPEERRRLVTWAAQALAPEFPLTAPLLRSSLTARTPRKTLEVTGAIKKTATDDERSVQDEENALIMARNAEKRRARTAAALAHTGPQKPVLSAVVLYQDPDMRARLVRTAEKHLNLDDFRQRSGPGIWTWSTPELDVHLHAVELGELGGALGGENPPSTRKLMEQAVDQRRKATEEGLRKVASTLSETVPPFLAFIELEGRYRPSTDTGFAAKADPKGAIRLGCADAGLVSQFFRPLDRKVEKGTPEEDAEHRVASAWADGLRQLGARLTPQHNLGRAIPADLNQVAFFIVKRQVDSTSNRTQFTPIAVLASGDAPLVATTPDRQEWISYAELLKDLTGQVSKTRSAPEQERITANFVRWTLGLLRDRNTLVVTHAQNSRYRWPGLQTARLEEDRIAIGDGDAKRLRFLGPHLRLARVATHDRDETPAWWSNPDREGAAAGRAKGLWLPGAQDPSGRVFYASAERTRTMQTALQATKLTPHTEVKPAKQPNEEPTVRDRHTPKAQAGTPQLIELTMVGLCEGDDAETWAMFLQQQRNTEDSEAELALPFVLHMAELTKEYALPYEDVEHDEDELVVGNEDDTPFQLALELDIEE